MKKRFLALLLLPLMVVGCASNNANKYSASTINHTRKSGDIADFNFHLPGICIVLVRLQKRKRDCTHRKHRQRQALHRGGGCRGAVSVQSYRQFPTARPRRCTPEQTQGRRFCQSQDGSHLLQSAVLEKVG